MTGFRDVASVLVLAGLAACAQPRYIDKAEGGLNWPGINEVVFQVHEAYKATPPECVAILPLKVKNASQPQATAEDAAKVRLSLFAHLATQSKRQVRLERVDRVLSEVGENRKNLGERMKCAAYIEGEVTEYGSTFLGVYSRVAAGADLRMVRASDCALLWEGHHVAASHGGGLLLDPVGVAMGVLEAVGNIRDEQILRVTDDLARRLVSTIPDDKAAALDDPGEAMAAHKSEPVDDLAAGEKLLAGGDHAGALAAAERSLAGDPNRAGAWFLKGRVLMLDREYAQAEPAILKAVALDRSNATYLTALGAVNAEKGAFEKALAAYRMAIDANPGNGFAWYNTGVIHANAGEAKNAADAFYGAGLAYLKAGDYARAERALGDLRGLAGAGMPLDKEITTIQDALAASAGRKT